MLMTDSTTALKTELTIESWTESTSKSTIEWATESTP